MRALLIAIALASTVTGCVPVVYPYAPVGSHTLKVAADQEADVVWVQKVAADETRTQLFRCHNSPQGPKCVEAKAP